MKNILNNKVTKKEITEWIKYQTVFQTNYASSARNIIYVNFFELDMEKNYFVKKVQNNILIEEIL